MATILDLGSERFKLFLIFKSPLCFLPSFSSGLEEANSRFSWWRPPWISDWNDFLLFLIYKAPGASYKAPWCSYQVSNQLAFQCRRRSKQKIFKMVAIAAILDSLKERLQPLLIYKSQRCFLPGFKPIGILVQQEKRKIDFQDGHHGSHLGFQTWTTILASFDLQVTSMLSTKFQVAFWFRWKSES